MSNLAMKIERQITAHQKVTEQCEKEFRSNRMAHYRLHGEMPSNEAVAREGVGGYARYAQQYVNQLDSQMARVMAKCAAHLAIKYLAVNPNTGETAQQKEVRIATAFGIPFDAEVR